MRLSPFFGGKANYGKIFNIRSQLPDSEHLFDKPLETIFQSTKGNFGLTRDWDETKMEFFIHANPNVFANRLPVSGVCGLNAIPEINNFYFEVWHPDRGKRIASTSLEILFLAARTLLNIKNLSAQVDKANTASFGIISKRMPRVNSYEFPKPYYEFKIDTSSFEPSNPLLRGIDIQKKEYEYYFC